VEGKTPTEILGPILIGPVLLLVFVALFVGMDPLEREWKSDDGEYEGDAADPGRGRPETTMFDPRR
jgi:hypothetical protein